MVFNEYRYKPGRSFPVAAQVAGEELEKLGIYERQVSPAEVVEAARSKKSPLNPVFEWDVRKAAQLHHEDVARALIRSVVIVRQVNEDDDDPSEVEDDEEREDEKEATQIAFVSVGTSGPKGKPGYIAVNVAMSDDDMRERVIRDAVAQLKGWQSRFRHIKELAEVVEAIDRVITPQPALA